MRTRVKICGLTQPEDVQASVDAGADAIGLVFYPRSPRYVNPDRALELIQYLPAFVTVVGLFLDAGKDELVQVLEGVPLDVLQFHGRESPGFCSAFQRPYLKALGMGGNQAGLIGLANRYADAAGLLLDSHAPGAAGGTGQVFDWRRILLQPMPCPVILAGGLNPDNVAEAVRTVHPYAVDVSSGVESRPGIKDGSKIIAFMREVKCVDDERDSLDGD